MVGPSNVRIRLQLRIRAQRGFVCCKPLLGGGTSERSYGDEVHGFGMSGQGL